MYKVEKIQDPDSETDYIYTTKNELGQILVLKVYVIQYLGKCYNVEFFIAKKRKRGFEHLKTTGKDGLKSLAWAKLCLKDFIYSYPKQHNINKIIVEADDSKRFRVYENKLKDLGFTKFSNLNSLIKKI
jgi:hypothetical protein